MTVLAALTLVLVNVQFSHLCDGEGDILICMNVPPYFSPGYSTLVMYLTASGRINSTVFRSDNLASVTRLRLDGAGVTAIAEGAFASLRNLSSLSLRNNALTRVSAGWLGRPAALGELSLAGNLMEAVDASTLRGLVGLTRLSLRSNSIATIAPDGFRSQTVLAELDLSDNRLTRIPARVFGLFGPARISLHGNPWDCSCEAVDSVVSLRELWGRSLLDAHVDVTCASPPPLTGAPVWGVSDVCATAPAPSGTTGAVTAGASAASPSQAETNASVRPEPTGTVTGTALAPNTAAHVTSSPPTETSVYPGPDATITASPSGDVTGSPSSTGCILTVVIAAAGLCALGLLVLLHRRTRKNKAVIPARPNRDGDASALGSGQSRLHGHSEKRDPETAGGRRFTGPRSRSADAVLSSSPFCALPKDRVVLREETETGSSAEGRQGPVNVAKPDQEESLSDTGLVVTNETRAGSGPGENLRRVCEAAPYLSIGPNPNDASPQSADGPGPRSPVGHVIGRVSTWPQSANQWQARCKLGVHGSDVVTGRAQNVMFKLSSETQNKDERLRTDPSTRPPTTNDAHVTPGSSLTPNDEIPSFSDACTNSDVMLEDKRTQDQAAGGRTQGRILNRTEGELPNPDLQKPTGESCGTGGQRGDNRRTGSTAPSGGASPDEFTFMDLLHEVVQNNGRWTRERWKQIHVNRQRR